MKNHRRTLKHLTQILGSVAFFTTLTQPLLGAEDTNTQETVTQEPTDQTIAFTPVPLERVELQAFAPVGWEINTDSPNMSMVAFEPALEKKVYDKAVYRRNITLVTLQNSAPLDEKRAKELEDELRAKHSELTGVEGFQILEHKFFDYGNSQKGLVVYSAYTAKDAKNEFPMMAMNILLSSDKRQYLYTYTDLENRFSSSPEFQLAFNAIASSEFAGVPPVRYQKELRLALTFLGFILLFIGIKKLRSRRAERAYAEDADAVYHDRGFIDDAPSTMMTQSMVWALDTRKKNTKPKKEGDFTSKTQASTQHRPMTLSAFTAF